MTVDRALTGSAAVADPAGPAGLRRSPLGDHVLLSSSPVSSEAVFLAELPFLTLVSLRAAGRGTVAQRVATALGVALPLVPNTVAEASPYSLLWLGPDEWAAVGPDGAGPRLLALLGDALNGDTGSVVDVSANRTTVEITGACARDLLEKGCSLDLHPRSFGAGQCAQTTVAKAQVVLWQTADTPTYRLLVRSSFASYLADWLVDAATEYVST